MLHHTGILEEQSPHFQDCRFLISWEGYGIKESTWEDSKDIKNSSAFKNYLNNYFEG